METIERKKITIARENIARYIDFLRCPLCGEGFGLPDFSLRCRNRHTYDLAKKGYVNLFNGFTKITQVYDKNLFRARKSIADSGMYSPLADELCRIISARAPNHPNHPDGARHVLDAGCGCGNLTREIFGKLGAAPKTLMFGADLSKEGIDFAASDFCGDNLIWLVANLNNLPFADSKFDVILNIMSPANYEEFRRVLIPGGLLLKVVPDADYLKELRRFIYGENDRNEYSNKDVLSNLSENLTVSELIGVKYTHPVAADNIGELFDMTPLTSSITGREEIKQKLIGQVKILGNLEVTLAFKIAVCEIQKDEE